MGAGRWAGRRRVLFQPLWRRIPFFPPPQHVCGIAIRHPPQPHRHHARGSAPGHGRLRGQSLEPAHGHQPPAPHPGGGPGSSVCAACPPPANAPEPPLAKAPEFRQGRRLGPGCPRGMGYGHGGGHRGCGAGFAPPRAHRQGMSLEKPTVLAPIAKRRDVPPNQGQAPPRRGGWRSRVTPEGTSGPRCRAPQTPRGFHPSPTVTASGAPQGTLGKGLRSPATLWDAAPCGSSTAGHGDPLHLPPPVPRSQTQPLSPGGSGDPIARSPPGGLPSPQPPFPGLPSEEPH